MVEVHPKEFVTVTVYVPASNKDKSSVVAPLLHKKAKGAPPPVAVKFNNAFAEPQLAVVLITLNIGTGRTITTTVFD